MVSGINVGSISQLYNQQKKEYSNLLYDIASGKEINKPSDDFVGYIRSSNISQDISQYEDINTNLTELNEPAQLASDLGNNIFKDINRMKELADLYGGTSDTDEQNTYNTEFKTLAQSVTDTIANNKYNNNTVVAAGTLAYAEINPDDSSLKISLEFDANDIPNVSGFDLTSETSSDVQDELNKITSYTTKADNYLEQISRQKDLNDNLISNKNDTIDAISGIDEAEALAKANELQIRQQASVAMMAQANTSMTYVAQLYS